MLMYFRRGKAQVQRDVLNALVAARGELTARQIANKVGIMVIAVYPVLGTLARGGLIAIRQNDPCTSNGKSTFYYRPAPDYAHVLAQVIALPVRPTSLPRRPRRVVK